MVAYVTLVSTDVKVIRFEPELKFKWNKLILFLNIEKVGRHIGWPTQLIWTFYEWNKITFNARSQNKTPNLDEEKLLFLLQLSTSFLMRLRDCHFIFYSFTVYCIRGASNLAHELIDFLDSSNGSFELEDNKLLFLWS